MVEAVEVGDVRVIHGFHGERRKGHQQQAGGRGLGQEQLAGQLFGPVGQHEQTVLRYSHTHLEVGGYRVGPNLRYPVQRLAIGSDRVSGQERV